MSNDLINKYAEAIQVERIGEGEYVGGVYEPGDAEELELEAVVMPIPPDEIKVLAEGQEDAAGIYVYAETEIKTANEAAGTKADVVIWNGKRWQVMAVHYRTQIPALAHWKATALAEDVG